MLLHEITVDAAVRELRPDFAVLVMVARGLVGGQSDDRSTQWLTCAGRAAVDPDTDPHVLAWRAAYKAFGAKPKRTRPSVDALLRRARATGDADPAGGLPAINAVVDAYNAVSVEYALPVGGEDLAHYRGAARLLRASGAEDFTTRAVGEFVTEHPEPGEVIWADQAGVTCRRWNWRQCVRTQITKDTTDVLFLLERLAPYPLDRLAAAGDALADRLRSMSPQAEIDSIVHGPW